jgi:hypothetical protein
MKDRPVVAAMEIVLEEAFEVEPPQEEVVEQED